jgi:ATP-dependent helicase/nuclease subunit B
VDPTLHLVTGPPGADLTAPLLAEYSSRARDVGSCLWLAPTGRAALEVRERIVAMGRPVLAPNVATLRQFDLTAGGLAVPDSTTRRLILDQVTTDLGRGGSLAYFRRVLETHGFHDSAKGLWDELESLGITPDQLAHAVRGPRESKLAAMAALYAECVRHAALLDPGRSRLEPSAAIRFVFIDGFTGFTPPEWRLVESLIRRAETWITLPGADDARGGAFDAVRETRDSLAGQFHGRMARHRHEVENGRPSGIAHLGRALFEAEPAATDAAGLSIIAAAGPVGEARLVARRIRQFLADGVAPDSIVVTARDLTYSRDLIGEVFDEYRLPVELDGDEPLLRVPVVSTLLRAVRLMDEGWPFVGLTALLRSTYFRPAWPECGEDTARRAEGLLRLLGEPRDRDAYLRAVRMWSQAPPDGLEDEGPEEPRRLRKARLAAECRPFLERLFAAWDGFPTKGSPADFASWIWSFAADVGLTAAAESDARDRTALDALRTALARWTGPVLSRPAFLRGLGTLAASESLPRSAPAAGRVRVVPAEEARHLRCDYLFVLGMGENGFPRLAPPRSLLDDADRQRLRDDGLPFLDPAARLGAEQLLLLQLVARPRRGLVLSYAAVDERGQPLLPGTFLRSICECFEADAIPVERQRMLIDGYVTQSPRSAAEARVQFAATRRGPGSDWRRPGLPDELCEHLRWAEGVAAARFRTGDYLQYDGWLVDAGARTVVRERFGADRVFSPTALEAFVACPFRFLLEHVLHLEELEEPGEEVEHTRRGAAYHRALSRLHQKLRLIDPEMPRATLPEHIGADLRTELDLAVAEYAARAPSPASKRLWELEGRRLHRSADRYRAHWEAFIDPWRKARTYLAPELLEADFGLKAAATGAIDVPPLVLSVGGVEVRIGGRIDRVDVAELDDGVGFWVIDYKTGRSTSYSAAGLHRFEKLQLPLYALAVERVFFPRRKVRPLGLAYWLVTDTGPKPVLPGRQSAAWLADPNAWEIFRTQLESWVSTVVGRIRDGRFPLAPRSDTCTDTCPYGQVCRISQSRHVGKAWDLALPGADDAGG